MRKILSISLVLACAIPAVRWAQRKAESVLSANPFVVRSVSNAKGAPGRPHFYKGGDGGGDFPDSWKPSAPLRGNSAFLTENCVPLFP